LAPLSLWSVHGIVPFYTDNRPECCAPLMTQPAWLGALCCCEARTPRLTLATYVLRTVLKGNKECLGFGEVYLAIVISGTCGL
jgi:hypothetical protein